MNPLLARTVKIGTDIRMSQLETDVLANTYRSMMWYRRARDMPRELRDRKLLKALLTYFEKKYPPA